MGKGFEVSFGETTLIDYHRILSKNLSTIFGGQGARSFRFWSSRSCEKDTKNGMTMMGMIDTMMNTKGYNMMK